jgi:poly(A) polymerase
MRAVRFHTEFNFVLDPETSTAVREMAPQIHTISAERIRDELIKMMTGRSPRDALVSLSHHGLLKEVLPEVEAFKGVEQPPEYHPEGDVWVHVCLMLSMCSYAPLELVLGVLFHDVGKPPTFVRAPDRIRFHNHQRVGVEMTDEIMRRLKFPNKTIDTVKDLVGQHMRFGDTHLMRKGKLKNFVLQENFDLHLELHRIDCMGSHQKLGNYELCKTTQEEVARTPEILEPLVNGKDLIALGMKPGPEFKEILEKTREAQLEGIIKTKDDAIGYIKETWKTSG